MDNIAVMLAEQRLRGRTDAVALLQLIIAAHRDPRALRREALDVILLLLQQRFRDQHGHINILCTRLLKLRIQKLLDILPDRVAIGTVNEHSLDGGVVDQLRLFAHIGVPLGKIDLHIRDLLDLLILCHFLFLPFPRSSGSHSLIL